MRAGGGEGARALARFPKERGLAKEKTVTRTPRGLHHVDAIAAKAVPSGFVGRVSGEGAAAGGGGRGVKNGDVVGERAALGERARDEAGAGGVEDVEAGTEELRNA